MLTKTNSLLIQVYMKLLVVERWFLCTSPVDPKWTYRREDTSYILRKTIILHLKFDFICPSSTHFAFLYCTAMVSIPGDQVQNVTYVLCYFVPIGIPYQTEKKQYFERMVEVKKELASKGINIDWSEEEHIHDNVPPGARRPGSDGRNPKNAHRPKTEKMFIPLCSLTKIATIRKRMSWKTTILTTP
ncbi:hypothetical protein L596_016483 [Steinernema carpocapsae]|uniref:Uncharacterized protein n=1 Tax=Steinernema carpocapsae TaxID=34508 RepID=A0A4U5NIZ7_STECR|nr:hypothetical protein L596_016483 [Steinernema carpocapsae]